MELKPQEARPPRHPRYHAIHRALVTGLISNVGTRTETHEYQGVRGVKFSIFPGSGLFGAKQKWIVAGELVETTKLYGRTCASIDPTWIERAAAHLVERSYADPRWDAASGTVISTEKVALYGLVLIPARHAPYGAIDPNASRDIFIRHALVLGDIRLPPFGVAFFRHNAELTADVEKLEAKIRQKNLLADEATRFAFYDAKVPQGIYSASAFEDWRHAAEAKDPRLLFMKKEDLLRADAPAITPENYPESLTDAAGGLRMPLGYRFEPGETTDGLTLTVPLAGLAQLNAEKYEWLVPGMLEEKISVMLRELPGALRRSFVPVPDWAKAAVEALAGKVQTQIEAEQPAGAAANLQVSTFEVSTFASGSLRSLKESLAEFLAKQTGLEIKASDFSDAVLPPHLKMNFRVLDDSGKVAGMGRDLIVLQRQLAKQAAGTFAAIYDRQFNREQITRWDFADLPDAIKVERFGMTISAYPALVDVTEQFAGVEQCALRLLPSKEMGEAAHRGGVRRLFWLEHRREIKSLTEKLPDFGKMKLQYLLLGRSEELRKDLLSLIIDRALFLEAPPPRKLTDYEAMKSAAVGRLATTAETVAAVVSPILEEHLKLALMREQDKKPVRPGGLLAGTKFAPTPLSTAVSADVHDQLTYLLMKRFLIKVPWEWLRHYPRYLAAIRIRLEKLREAGRGGSAETRDAEMMNQVVAWQNRHLERKAKLEQMGILDLELEALRWMLEEWRVSLFAQELGVAVQVSEKRVEKQWERVRV